jgi:hypothetical protein
MLFFFSLNYILPKQLFPFWNLLGGQEQYLLFDIVHDGHELKKPPFQL